MDIGLIASHGLRRLETIQGVIDHLGVVEPIGVVVGKRKQLVSSAAPSEARINN